MPLANHIEPKSAGLQVGIVHRTSWGVVMRTGFVKRLLEKVQATLTAAAFAEEGEVETARQMAAEGGAFRTDGDSVQE